MPLLTDNLKNIISTHLNNLDRVDWDRMLLKDTEIVCFGWLDKTEQYKDFCIVVFNYEGKPINIYTSSIPHSVHYHIKLDIFHVPCKRIEENLPMVKNSIKL